MHRQSLINPVLGILLLVMLCRLLMPSTAMAEKRVALVIGNSSYVSTTKLDNPFNDATDIAAVLERLGFVVVLGLDLDFEGMRRTRKKFNDQLKSADVALFFYAGHALQVDGVNYLAPIDTVLQDKNDLEFEAISLDLILQQMERNAKTNLVFLDACRDNPLVKRFEAASRSSGTGTGLAQPNISRGGPFIAFATSPGSIALDGTGRNSPFTTSLLRNIERPGIELSAMMIDVRSEVYEATFQQQRPWTNSGLLDRFYFKEEEPKIVVTVETDPEAETLRQEREETERQLETWNIIRNTNEPEIVREFLDKYPDGKLAKVAALKLEQLELLESVLEPEESTIAIQPETTQPKTEAAEGVDKTAEPQQDELEVAALPEQQAEREINLAAEQPEPVEPEIMTPEVVRSIQKELNRLGCDAGTEDGQWGPKGRRALTNFSENANVEYASTEPTFDLLDDLKSNQDRVCPLVCGARFYVSGEQCVLRTCASGLRLNSKGQCVKKTAKSVKKTPTKKPTVNKNCFKFNGQLVCE